MVHLQNINISDNGPEIYRKTDEMYGEDENDAWLEEISEFREDGQEERLLQPNAHGLTSWYNYAMNIGTIKSNDKNEHMQETAIKGAIGEKEDNGEADITELEGAIGPEYWFFNGKTWIFQNLSP